VDAAPGSLVTKLLEYSGSSNSDLAQASLEALTGLAADHDLSNMLPLNSIIELLEQSSEQVKIDVLRLVGTQPSLLVERPLLERVVAFALDFESAAFETTLGSLFAPRLRRIPYVALRGPEFAEVLHQLLMQLARIPYRNQSDKRWVRKKLWQAYCVCADLPFLAFPLSSTIDRFRPALATAILSLSADAQKASYMTQFREMLRIGSKSSQRLAVEVLSLLVKEARPEARVEELIDELINALRSPYREVRRAVRGTLGTIVLSPSQATKAISVLGIGLQSLSFPQKVLMYLEEAFASKGRVSVGLHEKIDVIRTMRELDSGDSRELEGLLLGFLEKLQVPKCSVWEISPILEVLAHGFDHRFDSESASRLMQIYREYERILPSRYQLGALRNLLVNLSNRFHLEDKKRLEQTLLGELRQNASVELLQGLRDLRANLANTASEKTVIPGDVGARLVGLLDHRDWHMANAAFEVALEYRVISV